MKMFLQAMKNTPLSASDRVYRIIYVGVLPIFIAISFAPSFVITQTVVNISTGERTSPLNNLIDYLSLWKIMAIVYILALFYNIIAAALAKITLPFIRKITVKFAFRVLYYVKKSKFRKYTFLIKSAYLNIANKDWLLLGYIFILWWSLSAFLLVNMFSFMRTVMTGIIIGIYSEIFIDSHVVESSFLLHGRNYYSGLTFIFSLSGFTSILTFLRYALGFIVYDDARRHVHSRDLVMVSAHPPLGLTLPNLGIPVFAFTFDTDRTLVLYRKGLILEHHVHSKRLSRLIQNQTGDEGTFGIQLNQSAWVRKNEIRGVSYDENYMEVILTTDIRLYIRNHIMRQYSYKNSFTQVSATRQVAFARYMLPWIGKIHEV